MHDLLRRTEPAMSRHPEEPSGPFLHERDAPKAQPASAPAPAPAAPPDLPPSSPRRARREQVGSLRTLRRFIALAFVALGLGGGLLSNALSGPSSSGMHHVGQLRAPIPTASQGRYALHLVALSGTSATLRDSSGRTYRWLVSDPSARAALRADLGTDAMIYWRRTAGRVEVVGVDGAPARDVPDDAVT
jgi:hypothetical protein